PKISQAHSVRQVMIHQVTRGLREQYLSPVPGTHNPCGVIHVQTDVAFCGKLWLACMQAYARTHCHTSGPCMQGQAALHLHCCKDSIGGASEGHEEGISLCVHLVSTTRKECGTQQGSILLQHLGIALSQFLQQ